MSKSKQIQEDSDTEEKSKGKKKQIVNNDMTSVPKIKVKKGKKTVIEDSESSDVEEVKPKKGKKKSAVRDDESKIKNKGKKKTNSDSESDDIEEAENPTFETEEHDNLPKSKIKKGKKLDEIKKKVPNLVELTELFIIAIVSCLTRKSDESNVTDCVKKFIDELNGDQIVEIYTSNKVEHEDSTTKTKIQVGIGNELLERFLPSKLELFLNTEDKEVASVLVEHFFTDLTSGLEVYKNCKEDHALYEVQQARWKKYRQCEWKCQLVKDKGVKDKVLKKTNDNAKASKKNKKNK